MYFNSIKIPGFTAPASEALIMTLGLLVFFTILFWGWGFFRAQDNIVNLKSRTKSWWVIIIIYATMMGIKKEISFIGLGFMSFIALRELLSKLQINKNLRRVLFWAYLAVPIQFYLAYIGNFQAFLLFIPVGMFFILPFRAIIEGVAEDSIKTFSQLHWALMLTVFSLSHIAYFISLPEIPGFEAGYQGIVYFLIFLTQINDIFQFISGKLFGKHKITPQISPNKTWEGFFGGLILTTLMGYHLSYLVPLNAMQTTIAAALIAIAGFFGDLNISAVKRDLNIKDMSNFIPGHGGILDRLDSLTFSSLFFFYLIYFWIYL
ncbi:MAG: phosphatidate cytidylyltransferase [Bacteriovoracaceae bacterium]|jgi:phosphatidate cytidylyltransferase|nr:phosphatidate cytidylyltransferase [Bacteriovoracaceae bacterium]